jgi:hypothetical protein
MAKTAPGATSPTATPVAKTLSPTSPGTSPQTPLPYTQGTGSPGPGPFAGGEVNFDLTGVTGPRNFETYGCKVFETDPLTPDWETATTYFERRVFVGELMTIPELNTTFEYWGFEDPLRGKGVRPFPSPLIRLRAGELAHVKLTTKRGQHTIHHHGIEPTTMNDGVGHVSFEVDEQYVYQWRPTHPGTWFYHCHVNTVLHFEMGLFGLLVVDPEDGWGRVHRGASRYTYQTEQFWVLDDVDTRWHTLQREAGVCGDDAGLNEFRPQLFFINGVHKARTAASSSSGQRHPVAVKATRNNKILIRILNAAYSVARIRIADLPFELVSVDGHSLVGDSERPWSRPRKFGAGEPMLLPTASRFDIWINPEEIPLARRRPRYWVDIEYLDWVTKTPHNPGQGLREGTARTFIDIDWS